MNTTPYRPDGWIARTVLLCVLIAGAAQAQEQYLPPGTPLPDYARQIHLDNTRPPALRLGGLDSDRPIIMLTGYWPPTNEMMRHFSDDPVQNPGGWVGENWEGRGYDVYAFFPEFPNGLGKGEGDFEVDYQDTSVDFWPLVDLLQPIAIISFGRAGADRDWELEGGNYRYSTSTYTHDYLSPTLPTPGLPFYYEPVNTFRASTLPLQDIIDAVRAAAPNANPYSTPYDDSRFLCSYMGYHSNWYHELHADPEDPAWNVTAGFIHLGSELPLPDCIAANEATLRAVIAHVDRVRRLPGDLNCDRQVDFGDINPFVQLLTNPVGWQAAYPGCLALNGDINDDGRVDFADINPFVALLTNP